MVLYVACMLLFFFFPQNILFFYQLYLPLDLAAGQRPPRTAPEHHLHLRSPFPVTTTEKVARNLDKGKNSSGGNDCEKFLSSTSFIRCCQWHQKTPTKNDSDTGDDPSLVYFLFFLDRLATHLLRQNGSKMENVTDDTTSANPTRDLNYPRHPWDGHRVQKRSNFNPSAPSTNVFDSLISFLKTIVNTILQFFYNNPLVSFARFIISKFFSPNTNNFDPNVVNDANIGDRMKYFFKEMEKFFKDKSMS